MILKPMKAETCKDLSMLHFPMLVSNKLDGIRATLHKRHDGKGQSTALSASLKPIQNHYIRGKLEELPPGLDGELGVLVNGSVNFRLTSGSVMRRDGMPDFKFYVFDNFLHSVPFAERYATLKSWHHTLPDYVEILEQRLVNSAGEVEQMFTEALAAGHEGLILRSPGGPYKHGRSTMREQWMIKMKPWEDTEALCIGLEEEMYNGNEATTNELGHTARSSHKANLVGKKRMGKLICRDPRWAEPFGVSGFTAADKEFFWKNPPIGEWIKFKHLTVGGYDKPRMAQFLGIRHREDMSE